MHWLTTSFLILLVLGTGLRLWLSRRQLNAVNAGRAAVPRPFNEGIELKDHHKAADYTSASVRLGMLDTVIDAVLLLGWTLGGGLALLQTAWGSLGWSQVTTGTAFILSAFIAMSALSLPLSAYKTFSIEKRFGFNRTTVGLYVSDMLKSGVLMVALGAPLIALVLWLMNAAGQLWWLYTWAVWVGFSMLLTWAYPAFIAPLFNKFSPLSDNDLKTRIEALLGRCGFRSQGIFVMDGSRRSSHGNAYFTGVGNNKRIVFFDTLIDSLDPLEIEAVLAHELGHFRKNHVMKRLIMTFAMALIGLAILGWLIQQPWFYSALGANEPSSHMALMLFLLVTPVFTFVLTPVMSSLSRRDEFEADEYAAEQSDANALVKALVKLYRDNATTLTPDTVHWQFYDSHPPAPVRIARLNTLGALQ